MKNGSNMASLPAWLRLALIMMAMALLPLQAQGQVPARFYWKSLVGANGTPIIFNSLSGNTNPFDPSHQVLPGGAVDATLAIAGYARTFALGERSAMAAILAPMGRVSGEVTVAGKSFNKAANGYGDPLLEFDVNVIGPTAQRIIPDILRYEPGFSLDLLADLAIPLGQYDSSQPLNLGQNRWYGRLGAPMVVQFGPWVPGRRTTLELLPAVWFFGKNTDFVGQTLKTDPLFQLDAHLTRDLTESFWGALDATYYEGGKSRINGVGGKKLNNFGFGLTFGYQINENLNLTVGYKSTLAQAASADPRIDTFMMTLVFGWHPLLEGARRLKEAQ
ncbi:transporter [Massilia agilis]|uniref:Transporter n=1 Tax=Massilia agilis TaxID=1811226 RepID=A0ABT2D516_9BURK|nr:transporter [Massilia agilis]MCS0806405.1 transporter [Massilia agilis]